MHGNMCSQHVYIYECRFTEEVAMAAPRPAKVAKVSSAYQVTAGHGGAAARKGRQGISAYQVTAGHGGAAARQGLSACQVSGTGT